MSDFDEMRNAYVRALTFFIDADVEDLLNDDLREPRASSFSDE